MPYSRFGIENCQKQKGKILALVYWRHRNFMISATLLVEGQIFGKTKLTGKAQIKRILEFEKY